MTSVFVIVNKDDVELSSVHLTHKGVIERFEDYLSEEPLYQVVLAEALDDAAAGKVGDLGDNDYLIKREVR